MINEVRREPISVGLSTLALARVKVWACKSGPDSVPRSMTVHYKNPGFGFQLSWKHCKSLQQHYKAAMTSQNVTIYHRKRRRRRKCERPPISAWLTLSDQLKTDVGLLSPDLWSDLFDRSTSEAGEDVRYVAITPWSPGSKDLVNELQWTILPVKAQTREDGEHSNLHFSASSGALQAFVPQLEAKSTTTPRPRDKKGREIRMIDVEPLVLDSIFVTVDGEALERHHEMQTKFGGGFHSSHANGYALSDKQRGNSRMLNGVVNGYLESHTDSGQEKELIAAIRIALASPLVVRQDNLLALPLPTHPITHVSFPPARVTFCEPVDQGLLSSRTKIIINREKSTQKSRQHAQEALTDTPSALLSRGNGDEISNGQFYSAVEDGQDGDISETEADNSSETSHGSGSDESSSDDPLDDAFSMRASQFAGVPYEFSSLITNADTRNGGTDSPGSVRSSFTATTARQAAQDKGKPFKPRSLVGKIPDEMLNPKPPIEEDEEARLYVDIRYLMKLGTFSGDWIKIRTSQAQSKAHWTTDVLDNGLDVDEFRVAKIYGLPGLSPSAATHYPKGNATDRRASLCTINSSRGRSSPDVWLPPILLANLGNPDIIRLSPLTVVNRKHAVRATRRTETKVPAASTPPIARELTLVMVSTPLVTEQAVQAGLMAATKQYFQSKLRVLRQGDLVPIAFDVDASRVLGQASSSSNANTANEELLSLSLRNSSPTSGRLGIAWFRVQGTATTEVEDSHIPTGIWAGMVSIDPSSTRMAQAGNEQCKIPSPESGYQFYIGISPIPRTSISRGILDKATRTIYKPYVSVLRRRLRELIAAATSPRAIHLAVDPIVILLHSTQRNMGKSTLATNAISDLGCHTFSIDAYELLSEGGPGGGDVKTEGIFQARIERALTCGPPYTAILIQHIEALTATRMISALQSAISSARVIIATTTEIDQLRETLRSLFTHEFEVSAPDETERQGLLHNIILDRGLHLSYDVDLSSLALKSAALVAGDLSDIVNRAITARIIRLESILSTNAAPNSSPILRDILLSTPSANATTDTDFSTALSQARASFATSIGAPKIPSVQWSDVGGLAHVKDAVMETIHLPLSRPELFAKGLKKRSGILLYGPPGTGKTLLAKAIATEFSLNFFSVKGPELLNMYIGESEANVRRVFQRARDARPCVVFFDELDSVAPKRGNQGDSGGVMDRIVSQLLAELDGMSDGDDGGKGGVFVIGATNRPDLLDAALLRPGRFDKMLYLGIPDTHEKQLTILQALTRKFKLDPEIQLARVAETLPFTYTGADLYALASDAMLKAITRRADAVDVKIKRLPDGPVSTAYFFDHLATEEDLSVTVTEEDFEVARKRLVGSVSVKELEHYKRVREAFEGPQRGKGEVERRPEIPFRSPTMIWDGKGESYGERKQVGGKVKVEDKGKGKAKMDDSAVGKGKGRARWDSSDEDDEAYETSLDFQKSPEREKRGTEFEEQKLEDEESLYE